MNHILAWAITSVAILLVLIRPNRIAEAVWACSAAVLLVLLRIVSIGDAIAAVRRGMDVYFFLTGMMLLSELARREGFFDWIASVAARAARGSRKRLFALVYGVGIVVTAFLSNDATAVVLTPAVFAAVKKAGAKPLPYLFACAFIANAASFILPISNPANLVVYGSTMPPLAHWLRVFGLPSVLSIAATFAVLRVVWKRDLNGAMESTVNLPALSSAGRTAAYGILGTAIALMLASAFNLDLGLPTLASAAVATMFVTLKDRRAPLGCARNISWSVLPLVAGLFILVDAVGRAGALAASRAALEAAARTGPLAGSLVSGFSVALLSNVANNLPVGLIAGSAVRAVRVPELIRNALLIGVDLGPNLSVTGSLATILWLVALRREGEDAGFWTFIKYGIFVMPPALALAILSLLLTPG